MVINGRQAGCTERLAALEERRMLLDKELEEKRLEAEGRRQEAQRQHELRLLSTMAQQMANVLKVGTVWLLEKKTNKTLTVSCFGTESEPADVCGRARLRERRRRRRAAGRGRRGQGPRRRRGRRRRGRPVRRRRQLRTPGGRRLFDHVTMIDVVNRLIQARSRASRHCTFHDADPVTWNSTSFLGPASSRGFPRADSVASFTVKECDLLSEMKSFGIRRGGWVRRRELQEPRSR